MNVNDILIHFYSEMFPLVHINKQNYIRIYYILRELLLIEVRQSQQAATDLWTPQYKPLNWTNTGQAHRCFFTIWILCLNKHQWQKVPQQKNFLASKSVFTLWAMHIQILHITYYISTTSEYFFKLKLACLQEYCYSFMLLTTAIIQNRPVFSPAVYSELIKTTGTSQRNVWSFKLLLYLHLCFKISHLVNEDISFFYRCGLYCGAGLTLLLHLHFSEDLLVILLLMQFSRFTN